MRDAEFWEEQITTIKTPAQFLIAKLDRESVGFTGSAYRDDQSWELVWLFVLPETQGMGVGSLLHDELLAGSSHLKILHSELWAVPGNLQAQRFYIDRGWVPTPEHKSVPTPAGSFLLHKWILVGRDGLSLNHP